MIRNVSKHCNHVIGLALSKKIQQTKSKHFSLTECLKELPFKDQCGINLNLTKILKLQNGFNFKNRLE